VVDVAEIDVTAGSIRIVKLLRTGS